MSPLNIIIKKTTLQTFLFIIVIFFTQHAFCQENRDNRDVVETITYNYTIPNYLIADTVLPSSFNNSTSFKYIHLFNSPGGVIDSVGFPELPFLAYNYELPYDAYDIRITMSEMQYDYFFLGNHILPYQGDFDKDANLNNLPFRMDNAFYTSQHFYLSSDFKQMNTFFIRGQKGIRVVVMPFNYNPYLKQLRILQSAKIKIQYHTRNNVTEPLYSDTWNNILSNVFVNHSLRMRAPANGKYLILTLPQYEDAIQYFANYKKSLEYDVSVYTLNPQQRTPSAIKHIIQERYDDEETRPDFILLVGDHPELPAFSGDSTSEDIDNPITDVPYAFLEGDDYYRDALIGRWPVHSVDEVQTITNKTIYMEMNMQLYEKKAVFIAGAEDNSVMQYFFEDGHRTPIDNTFVPNGYQCTQLNQPDRDEALYYLDDDPLFYIYSGHGFFDSWSVRPIVPNQWWLISTDINSSSHNTYPTVIAFACLTGNFAASNTSIAESWINSNNGAVVYLGSSVNTKVLSDYSIEDKLLNYAFYQENSIGGIIGIGMNRYYDGAFTFPSRAKRYMKSYNLMGDPSFMVRGLGCVSNYYIEQMQLESGAVQYYRAADYITFEGQNRAKNGSKLILRAGQSIVLKDGFVASAGSEVSAQIKECVDNNELMRNAQTVSDSMNNKYLMYIPAENDNTIEIKLYPNPASTLLYVETNNVHYDNVSMHILDVFGRLVQLIDNGNPWKTVIDISHFSPGCYYVVINVDNTNHYKCFIKQ